jgi:hypothetical protein
MAISVHIQIEVYKRNILDIINIIVDVCSLVDRRVILIIYLFTVLLFSCIFLLQVMIYISACLKALSLRCP